MTDVPQTDYDSPWKEIIERYFPEFMAFFFPQAYAKIDWSNGYTFLDKELQQVVRNAETGTRRVDKLVKVTRASDGKEAWVLIHVEVQGQPELDFPERMYIYNYRLFDRYQREYSRQDIIELFRFIDWIMTLPPELEEHFMADVTAYETQERKPYVTSVERIAAQRGLQQGLEQGLQQGIRETILEFLRERFDDVPEELAAALAQVEDLEALRALSRGAATAVSLDAFSQLVQARMTEE